MNQQSTSAESTMKSVSRNTWAAVRRRALGFVRHSAEWLGALGRREAARPWLVGAKLGSQTGVHPSITRIGETLFQLDPDARLEGPRRQVYNGCLFNS
jgi:hypothetical protein